MGEWPRELRLLATLIGRTNANYVCGKAPGTLLVERGLWGSAVVDGQFVSEGSGRFDGENFIWPVRLETIFRVNDASDGDGSMRIMVREKPEGWNRAKGFDGRYYEIRDCSGNPLFPMVVIPDEVDVKIEADVV